MTPRKFLFAFLSVYVLVFFWLACCRLEYGRAESGDVAAMNHVFWSALHGKFFVHFAIDRVSLERCYFAQHQEWLIFLIFPIYALVPHPQTLFFFQTSCIALAAIPMYLIARRVLRDEWSAVFIAMALVLFPSVAAQNVDQIPTSIWVLPLVLGAFWFYLDDDFCWFTVFTFLAAMGKENTALTLFCFVPYALWQRRAFRWWVTPLAISTIMLFLNLKVAQPYFAQGWKYEGLSYLSNLGRTWGEVFAGLLSSKLLSALTQPGNGRYLLMLFQPVMWLLPLLAPEFIFALPDLGVNLVASNGGMKVIAWHYNCLTGAFLLLAATFAIPRIKQWFIRVHIEVNLCPVLPAVLVVFALAHWPFWFAPSEYCPLPHYEAQRQARDLIPDDASLVVAPQLLIGQFSCRLKFTSHDRLNDDPKRMFAYDWAYFDMNYGSVPVATVRAYGNNPDFECVYANKNVFVFRRKGSGI